MRVYRQLLVLSRASRSYPFSNVNPMDLTGLIEVNPSRGCVNSGGCQVSIQEIVNLMMHHCNVTMCFRLARARVYLWSRGRKSFFCLGGSVPTVVSLSSTNESGQFS